MAKAAAQIKECRVVMSRIARRLHGYLMLVVGGQMLLWALSGLYMVWFDIHYIPVSYTHLTLPTSDLV